MEILITNDDGYNAKGITVLAEIMQKFGNVTVIAPKHHQSGMSMAVSLGLKQIAHRQISENWHYLDATPASCVKFGLNTIFLERFPDVVISGINHGSNAASASCYSGTLGAALEAAVNGIPGIGVSLDTIHKDADFSAVEKYFPQIFQTLMADYPKGSGIIYSVNFPNIPAGQIRGIRAASQGRGRWIKEFAPWNPEQLAAYGYTPEMLGQKSQATCEQGETLYMMSGEFLDDPTNSPNADHLLMAQGYVTITPHSIDTTDYGHLKELEESGINVNF